VAGGEPRAREHEAGVALGQLEREPGANGRTLARRQGRRLERAQVEARVPVVGPRGQDGQGMQAADPQAHDGAGARPFTTA